MGLHRLRALVAGSEEGMVLTDETGRILYANPATERLLGVPLAELIGRPGASLTRPDHLFMAREVLTRTLAAPGEPFTCTLDVVLPGGEFRTIDFKVVNRLDSPGISALVAHFRESTATAGELGESYRALFQKAVIGLGVADMQGNLLAFNEAMLKPGGYTEDDIRQISNVAKLYADPADRTRILQILRAKGHVWREKVPFLRKDGSSYDTLLSLTPVVFLGRPCLYATVEELTREGPA